MTKGLHIVIGVIVLFCAVNCMAQKSCTEEKDCDSVSEGKEYVHCVNGVCKCWIDRGFVGNATASNQCRCESPRVVQKVGNNGNGNGNGNNDGSKDRSYCVDITACGAQVAIRDRCNILENITKTIYTLVEYPKNLQILAGTIDLHNFVTETAESRFTPVGEFHGEEGFIEYYYALGSTEVGFVQKSTFRTIACDRNVVHFRVDLVFNQTLNPVGPPIRFFNFTHVGYFAFDDDNRINVADITFTNMGFTADIPADATVVLPPGSGNPPVHTRDAIIQGLCYVAIPQYCTGANQQFATPEECMGFMYSIPYGSFDRANSNTVTCRTVHSGLIPLRPDMHCPHVGPTGGGKCVDFTAASYYESPIEAALDALVAN